MTDKDQAEFDAWKAERAAERRATLGIPATPAKPLDDAMLDDGKVWRAPDSGGDLAEGWHLYEGARIGILGNPEDRSRAIVHAIGGEADEPAFISDGVAFTLSAEGLRSLAADLIAAAATLAPESDL